MLSWIVQLTTFNQLKSTCKEDFQQSFLSPKSPSAERFLSVKVLSQIEDEIAQFFSFPSSFRGKKKKSRPLSSWEVLFVPLT